jgi:WD40 repeat protein
LMIWDVATGKALVGPIFGHEAGVESVAFSPDGSRVVSGGGIPYEPTQGQARVDYSLRLWDAVTGRPIGHPLLGHRHDVLSVAFNRAGTRVASASLDGSIREWVVFGGWADALCTKLARNPTAAEWREWIGPDISYVAPCPGLRTTAPGR